jgi:hypothetical protein
MPGAATASAQSGRAMAQTVNRSALKGQGLTPLDGLLVLPVTDAEALMASSDQLDDVLTVQRS